MSTALEVFDYEGAEVRTFMLDGEPLAITPSSSAPATRSGP